VTVFLKPSPGQQAALDQLLAEQQDPSSANYHQWLTPKQFADRFGASQSDIDKIIAWLQGHGLAVTSVARSRNAISFSGSAAAVGQVFGVELHHYLVNGERHFANAKEPAIPVALAGIVGAIRGLNDFRMKPASLRRKVLPQAETPEYTSTSGNHYLAPEDTATIYNLKPLFAGGIDGSGQSLVVVGQTRFASRISSCIAALSIYRQKIRN
jgi:subtilase family serine protease